MTSLKYSKIVSKSEKPGATTELCGDLLSCDLLGSPGAVPGAGGEGGLTAPYHWAGLLLRAQSFLRGGVGFLSRFRVLDRCPSHLFRMFIGPCFMVAPLPGGCGRTTSGSGAWRWG